LSSRLEGAQGVVNSLEHVGEKDGVVGIARVVEIYCSTGMKNPRRVPESLAESSDHSPQVSARRLGMLQPAGSRGGVEVDQSAASAAYGQEGVRAGAAIEVLADGNRFGVVVVTDEALGWHQH
jgi:hypothetical protein